MDILSHGLWAGASAALANKRIIKKPLNVRLAAFFGILPDLFAFTLLPIWIIINFFQRDITLAELPRDLPPLIGFEPVPAHAFWIFPFTALLYALSHSAIVFFLIAVTVLLVKRRIVWEMLGWPLHIVIDVFTHSYEFYPTPVFWPLSVWRFDGLAWHTPWFMLVNYGALAAIYLVFIYRWRRRKISHGEETPILSLFTREFDVRLATKKIIHRYKEKLIKEV